MKNVNLALIKPSIFSSNPNFNPFVHQDPTFNRSTYTSFASALQLYINSDNPRHGQKIHAHILKTGFKPNTNISIKLLILHLKSFCSSYARQVFDEMSQPTLSAYNYMISGYIKEGKVEESFDMVRRLGLCDEKPDGFTLSMILKASGCDDSVMCVRNSIGKHVHAQIVKADLKTDTILYTALVDSYIKNRNIDYARKVFDLMPEKNVVCSTSLISGYMADGSVIRAKEIFEKTIDKDVIIFNAMIEGYSKSVETSGNAIEIYIDMKRGDFRPTLSTFASIIGACSALSEYEIGQQIQAQIVKTPFFEIVKLGSALLDMYCKCGRVLDARRVFDEMSERNVFTWTSMIDGYGKNGNPSEALELFTIMQKDFHIEPNYVTFLSAISACSHAGLIQEGKKIFKSMESDYKMKPKMEHYACMVDLLGRAGSINEACEFIIKMPDKPNSDVWAALLSSSRLHGDLEMANLAANEIFKLSGDYRPGAYVAFSNTLAEAGKWDNVSEIRELMKVRMIKKDTGFTWIGGDGGLKSFHAGQKV